MRVSIAIILIQLWGTYYLQCQSSAPKYSNEFLAIGVGARSLAMGGAQSAIVADATASYWNPAGLVSIEDQHQASFMHASYFAGIANYDYLGVSKKVDTTSTLAIAIIRFAVDDIPDTRFIFDANGALNYSNIQFFSAADYAFLLSYGRRLPIFGQVDVGGSLKIVHRTVGSFASAWGFGFDVGAQKRLGKWQLGISLRDVTSTFNAWSHNTEAVRGIYNVTDNLIPTSSLEITLPRMLAGIGRHYQVNNDFGILTTMDLEITFDGKRNTLIKSNLVSVDPRIGLEADYQQMVYLRTGFNQFQRIKNFDATTRTAFQPNFGLGLKLGQVSLDYALTDIADASDAPYSHIFSIKVSFEKLSENGK